MDAICTKSILSELFSKESKQNDLRKDLGLALHYLVASDESVDKVKKWASMFPDQINYCPESKIGLSPLSVSVITGANEVTELLLQLKSDPTQSDNRGWTPLHHAKIWNNQEALEMLINQCDEQTEIDSLVTHCKGTINDLGNLTHPIMPQDEDYVCDIMCNGELEPLTSRQFTELTGAQFCPSVLINSKDLMELWKVDQTLLQKKCYQLSGIPEIILESAYKKCMENPCELYLKGGVGGEYVQGFDVIAGELIEAYQGIAIYCGEYKPKAGGAYSHMGVHGDKVRNLGAMINDSFPNCHCYPVMASGFFHSVYIALDTIEEGQVLCWNYGGSHDVKLNLPHVELNPKALLDYARNLSIDRIMPYLAPNWTPQNDIEALEFVVEREKLKYLFQTPSSLLYLLGHNCFPISKEIYTQVLNSGQFNVHVIVSCNETEWIILESYIYIFRRIFQNLDTLDDSGKKQLQDAFCQWSERWEMKIALPCCDRIIEFLENSETEIGKFISEIDTFYAILHEIEHYSVAPSISDEELFDKVTEWVLELSNETLSMLAKKVYLVAKTKEANLLILALLQIMTLRMKTLKS